MVLCGISSRFQLLSPSLRQVTHALLTRSPLRCLIILRRFSLNISVRLACVRRAASVRPEPGSNSLVNCIFSPKTQYRLIRSVLNANILNVICLSRISFVSSSIYSLESQGNCFNSVLFNFQGTLAALSGQLIYYITSSRSCQKTFLKK